MKVFSIPPSVPTWRVIKKACARRDIILKPCSNSWSLGVGTKTIAKIIPFGDKVFVGVREKSKGQLSNSGLCVKHDVQGVTFYGTYLTPNLDDLYECTEIKAVMSAFSTMANGN